MVEVTFTNPVYLWTLLLIPFIILTHILTLKYIKTAALKFSNFEAIERVSKGKFLGKSYKRLFRNKNIFLLFLRLMVYILLILSVTGTTLWYTGKASDFDFILAIDTSTSMLADDFDVTRLEAAKESAIVFVDSVVGQSDIGVVSFASTVFIDKEPTADKREVKEIINQLNIKESGGTNVGDALIISSNLLAGDESSQKSKVIVLLTDGQSNIGTPIDIAVDYAKTREIIVHTIGIGTEEGGKLFGLDILSKLDEESLKEIASQTNGRYFRAESKDTLENTFKEIASFTERSISLNITWILLITALILLALEWVLIHTIYRIVP
jgi:Ca-activated chloride channel family protein|tara:strand:- start:92 stop:1063 length:972 start_codon:yes stop_codon:yes gene_type:complete